MGFIAQKSYEKLWIYLFANFFIFWFDFYPSISIIHPPLGGIAQLVEQWIENPCVPGSSPGLATTNI